MDSRAEVIAILPLVEVNTLDGPYRFILGVDGQFTDINGNEWIGSTILSGGDNEMMIGDMAPQGSLTVTFIQDPSMPDVVAQMKALGKEYVEGLEVRFYQQSFKEAGSAAAPADAPELVFTRMQTGLTFNLEGPAQRAITLTYEGPGANRNLQRRMVYNTADHARLIGRQNPSLQYIPQAAENDEPLFG